MLYGVVIRNCPAGAILVRGDYGFSLTLNRCAFFNNGPANISGTNSSQFAAIYVDRVSQERGTGSILIKNCTFDGNR